MKKLVLTLFLCVMSLPLLAQAGNIDNFSKTAKAVVFAEEESCGTPKFAPHEMQQKFSR